MNKRPERELTGHKTEQRYRLYERGSVMKTRLVMVALAVCGWVGYGQVQAEDITIEIAGNITSINGTGIPETIYPGVNFTGSYTYDLSTVDSEPSNIKYGAYWHDAPYGISVFLGGYEFKTDPTHAGEFLIYLNDGVSAVGHRDYYGVESFQNITQPPGIGVQEISWVLGDGTLTALSSDLLPTTAPLLTDWDYNDFRIIGEDASFVIHGVVTEAVPEPCTIGLMAMGAFFCLRRRK